MDKEDRRKNKEREKELERLLSVLPMRKHFVKEYFDYLDKYIESERRPSLNLTKQFCKDNALDFEKVKTWAAEFEAFDDQSILWKVEEVYEEVMKSIQKPES